jgi:hypothetical protein
MVRAPSGQHQGVGASIVRKEDDRHLRGRGQFVADIALRGTQEVVFLRSPHAHARIGSVAKFDLERRPQQLNDAKSRVYQPFPGSVHKLVGSRGECDSSI